MSTSLNRSGVCQKESDSPFFRKTISIRIKKIMANSFFFTTGKAVEKKTLLREQPDVGLQIGEVAGEVVGVHARHARADAVVLVVVHEEALAGLELKALAE